MRQDDEEILEIWKRYKPDCTDMAMRNRLIDRYFYLVEWHARKISQRFTSSVVDHEDLVSAGFFGLLQTFDSFDPERGVRFETYSAARIRGAMTDELRRLDPVPRLMRLMEGKRNRATTQLQNRLGRRPTDEEVASELGIEDQLASKMIAASTPPDSISNDTILAESDNYVTAFRIRDMIVSNSESGSSRLASLDQMRLLTRGLNREERLIIILYYYGDQTMKAVGKTLGLSESRVSQLHSAIVARLAIVLSDRRDELF